MENKFLVMVTKLGVIKKTEAEAFAKIRSTGIRAVNLHEGDELSFCSMSSGNDSIVIATKKGRGVHFKETEVRPMGRQAAGVRGILLRSGDEVVGMEVISDSTKDLLFATAHGYGKRVKITDFRVAHRGGLGVRTIPTDTRNGFVIGLAVVAEESHLLLIDTNGKIIRLSPHEIRTMGRQAKGVRLVRVDEGLSLAAVVAFEEEGSGELEDATDLDQNVQNLHDDASQQDVVDGEEFENLDDDNIEEFEDEGVDEDAFNDDEEDLKE
jgi:DNA gyrase subunit A